MQSFKVIIDIILTIFKSFIFQSKKLAKQTSAATTTTFYSCTRYFKMSWQSIFNHFVKTSCIMVAIMNVNCGDIIINVIYIIRKVVDTIFDNFCNVVGYISVSAVKLSKFGVFTMESMISIIRLTLHLF